MRCWPVVSRPRHAAPGSRGRRARSLTALSALLLAASCSAAPGATPPIVPGTADHPRTVNVILHDYSFTPTPIDLVPGETVRFNVIDAGTLAHEFVLGPQVWQDAWAAAEASDVPGLLGSTPPPASVPAMPGGLRLYLESGQTLSAVYTVPTASVPLLACHIPGHLEKGMVGAVRFVGPGAAATAGDSPGSSPAG